MRKLVFMIPLSHTHTHTQGYTNTHIVTIGTLTTFNEKILIIKPREPIIIILIIIRNNKNN